MSATATTFLCIVLCSQVNSLPFFGVVSGQDSGYSPILFSRNYAYAPNPATTYVTYQVDPVTGEQVPTHYITHSRPGSPISALIQNALNTFGRFVGDVKGAFGNALGGALASAGQLGQDIIDFNKPITVSQIVRPYPDQPLRPLPVTGNQMVRPYPDQPLRPLPVTAPPVTTTTNLPQISGRI